MRGSEKHPKLTGTAWFMSESDGDCQTAEITRAILRPKNLAFDCLTSEGPYAVSLDLHSHGRCNGRWWYIDDGEEHGDIVQARLYVQSSTYALIGDWRERGTWKWFAELAPAGASDDESEHTDPR